MAVTAELTTRDVELALGHRIARCWSRVLHVATGRLFRREGDDCWREYGGAR